MSGDHAIWLTQTVHPVTGEEFDENGNPYMAAMVINKPEDFPEVQK